MTGVEAVALWSPTLPQIVTVLESINRCCFDYVSWYQMGGHTDTNCYYQCGKSVTIGLFLSVFPHKRHSPFFYTCPTKSLVLLSVPVDICDICHFCPSSGTDKSGKLTLFSVSANINSPDGVTQRYYYTN